MTERELKILLRIPKAYRKHITELTVTESGWYDPDTGRPLKNYTITYDNSDEHTFQNVRYMMWAIKEYTDDNGYYRD